MGRDRDVAAFDRRAASYEHGWLAAWHDRITARSADIATRAAPGAQRILDVGCGTGALLRTLADRLPAAIELVGVDPAVAMIAAGRSAPALDPRIHFGEAGPSGSRTPMPRSTWS
jgi:ubiquinone/menaquinone biosynthesis C-methylase UbiE